MRTTIDIPDALFRQAKRRATDDGTSLREVVLRALRAHLSPARKRARYALRWRTEGGGLLVPPELLDSRVALHEYLDDPERWRGGD